MGSGNSGAAAGRGGDGDRIAGDAAERLAASEAERFRLHAALYAIACLNSDAMGSVMAREALGLPERFSPHLHVLAAAGMACYGSADIRTSES